MLDDCGMVAGDHLEVDAERAAARATACGGIGLRRIGNTQKPTRSGPSRPPMSHRWYPAGMVLIATASRRKPSATTARSEGRRGLCRQVSSSEWASPSNSSHRSAMDRLGCAFYDEDLFCRPGRPAPRRNGARNRTALPRRGSSPWASALGRSEDRLVERASHARLEFAV